MDDKKLFLLDGHALVYRAHFAFINRPLINSKGLNVSAISGFTRLLWDVIRNQKPSHIAVAFDPSGPTFRHTEYAEYKANREEQPEDIGIALPIIQEILSAFNIPMPIVPTFEADDVICTLAKQAEQEGFKVFMMTSDKDYAQAVSDNIYLYKPGRKGGDVEIMGVQEVLNKWGIKRVEQVVDMLGLCGDSVDNIPGIPGIGPKTAQKLLEKYDSVEGLIEHVEELKGKQKERVIQFGDQGLLSKKLAKIDCYVPIKFDSAAYEISALDKGKLGKIFKELEFRSLANSILGKPEQTNNLVGSQRSLFNDQPPIPVPEQRIAKNDISNTSQDYSLVNKIEEQKKLASEMSKLKLFCFDTETTGLDANEAHLVGISFSWKPGIAYYIPIPSDREEAIERLGIFKSVLEDVSISKVAQNIKYDALILKWYGIELQGYFFDTMIAHYLLEPELRHNMDYLSETYLGYKPISIESLIGKKGKKQKNMRDLKPEDIKDYAAEDADITLRLYEILKPKLEKEGLLPLYDKIEAPLIKALIEMEFNGVTIDVDTLNRFSTELESSIIEKQKEIYSISGKEFNISSPKQIGQVLFEDLEIPYKGRKTKTGQYSTNEGKLSSLAPEYPIIQKILHFRKLSKLKSTYVDALPKLINPKSGRIHSSFNQAIAATGRLSSQNPNLQNIPIRDEDGAKVRESFIPRSSDYVIMAADYSQIELRLIAEISNDEAMLEAFINGQDFHTATAARVFNVPYEEVNKDQRYKAKTVNFSITYGAGSTNLSKQLGIKRTEAQELIDQYKDQFKGLTQYMDDMISKAREDGFVATLLGRRRYIRDINSRNGLTRNHAENSAINTPIQGTAADMIKVAMVKIHKRLKSEGFKSKMIMQVHDELVFDAYKEELERLELMVKEEMTMALPNLKVPIVVEVGTGENWRVAH